MIKLRDYIGVFALSEMQDKEAQNKISALSLFLRFGFLVVLFYIVYNFVMQQYNGVVISSIFLFVLVVFILALRKFQKYNIIAYSVSLLAFCVLIVFFITGGFSGYDILWSYIFPAFTLFLLGVVAGSVLNILLLAVFAGLSFFSQFPLYGEEYTVPFKAQFFASYVSVWGVSFIYEYVRKHTRQNLIQAMSESQKSQHSSKAKAEFILELSHQIRTPLSSIFGILNLLRDTKLDLKQKDLLDGINTSANNLVTVVDNIVNIGEIRTDSEKTTNLTFNLEVILRKSFDEFQLNHFKGDVKYSINISDYIPEKLIGNPARIGVILKSLLLNIYDNSKKKTAHIDLFVSDKKETSKAIELMFELHSNSIKSKSEIAQTQYDYSATNQERARLDAQRNIINESDINSQFDLITAKKIVESFGGSLGIKKKDESITVFWFTLLLWKASADTKTIDTAKNPILSNSATVGTKRPMLAKSRVLIVEDNLMNQKVISLALKNKVISYELANNGKEAVEMFGNAKYDIILMDIMMPVLDGYKAAQKIRELEIGTDIHTPIIALTANALQGDKDKCFELGMNDYVSKPFQIDDLLDRMERALRV